jgi:hypothetical protein
MSCKKRGKTEIAELKKNILEGLFFLWKAVENDTVDLL